MIHLRLSVPDDLTSQVTQGLLSMPAVAHLATVVDSSLKPEGSVVLVDVARSEANAVIEWLQDLGVHHRGSISIETLDAVVSDSAQHAEESSTVKGEDVLIWESLEAQARNDSRLSASFLVFISIATIIAVVGILLDSPVLIVAAMVVGPEYGPISAVCVAAARGRWSASGRALFTLMIGLLVALAAGAIATMTFRLTGIAPSHYELSARQLTAFISRPDALAAVVAVLAGIVGMLSLTESKSNALVGVLVSVTTVPAIANAGAAAAYMSWTELGGSAAQLAINVAGLLVAGVVTVMLQSRYTSATPRTPTAKNMG